MNELFAGIKSFLSSPTRTATDNSSEGGAAMANMEGVETQDQQYRDIEEIDLTKAVEPLTALSPDQNPNMAADDGGLHGSAASNEREALFTKPELKDTARDGSATTASTTPLPQINPALSEQALEEAATSSFTEESSEQFEPWAMSDEKRLEAYADAFADYVEPLEILDECAYCEKYPDYREEIQTAYLQHTTFTAKIWVNYDAVDGEFHDGRRSDDCGKLYLSTSDRKHLDSPNLERCEMQKVRLLITTPFRDLCQIDLHMVNTDTGRGIQAQGNMLPAGKGHGSLINFLKRCLDDIEHIGLTHGVSGMTLQDLYRFAMLFRRRPAQEGLTIYKMRISQEWEMPCKDGGEWAKTVEQAKKDEEDDWWAKYSNKKSYGSRYW